MCRWELKLNYKINNNAFGNPISIKESFDLSLEIIINGIESLEGVK